MHRLTCTSLLTVALALLAACTPATENSADSADATDVPAQSTRLVATPPELTPLPTNPPANAAPLLPVDTTAVRTAIDDLAAREGIDIAEISVFRAEPVTWSDGSLGCPQPDMMYTQALVDGMFIQLQVGDTYFNYHSGGNQDPFLCEGAATVAPGELPPGAISSGSQ